MNRASNDLSFNAAVSVQMPPSSLHPRGILETALYSSDLSAAEKFFISVFELELVSREPSRSVFFRCGRGMLLVFNPASTANETMLVNNQPVPLHGAVGPGHMAFAVADADLPAWRRRLQELGVPIEVEVAWPCGGHSIYVRDPAGNSIELATPRLWGISEEAPSPSRTSSPSR
jgi:catechol 2,3-dioxygenase-like lactoylglutathione lyase family enzyme